MATLGSVLVADRDSPHGSGGAFLLAQACEVDSQIEVPPGSQVETRKGNPYVVARLDWSAGAADAFNAAYEASQKGLDLLAVQGKACLSTRNASEECIVWWRESSTKLLRVISVVTLSVTVGSPTLSVTDSTGKVVTPPPQPPIIYDESFRCIRLAELTDDVFDAFRNMYLAFERLLEGIAPRRMKERESSWLRRALSVVNQSVPLNSIYKAATKDIVDDVLREIHHDIRCAIFHSKCQAILLPLRLADRRKVAEGLYKLTRMVLPIADHWMNAKRRGGGLFYSGFNLLTLDTLKNSAILLSDDDSPLDKAETIDSAPHANAIEIPTRYAAELSEPGINCVLGTVDLNKVNTLQRIARFGLRHDNNLVIGATLEAELINQGIDRLEVQLGVQLRNSKEPKRLYKM
jgi:hypothetical protein